MADLLKPRQALNKAFLKLKPLRAEIERFKGELTKVLERSNETESEEFHKNLISDFLKHCWYGGRHFINTKGRKDLVIHNGKDSKSPVGVILEVKKPTNRAEMVRTDALNCKAMQELLLYYFRERVGAKNLELRHLVVTNIYEWFVFDAQVFERVFARDKKLVKQFEEFEAGRLSGTTTDFFYREIASPALDAKIEELEFAHFDIRDYKKPLLSDSAADDRKLVALYKLLSPEHLLKKPFANDSNSLNEEFYLEFLHIIGLQQTGKSKKLIQRIEPDKRDEGSLLENAIEQLELTGRMRKLPDIGRYGSSRAERLFNVSLELVITWMNRVLFLKLLEAQLLNYHKGEGKYAFLRSDRIKNLDDLQILFFAVLARQPDERPTSVREDFDHVPYLNSSLFEATELEEATLFVNSLRDDRTIEVYPKTVLKTYDGKRRSGRMNTLEYLFSFLNHYDFSSEGGEDIQEDNKTLINASVLGLIFEKINGYKDGSFFTPGFITMYMCRETIRRAVLQKFREEKNWDCDNLDQLYDRIEDRAEANRIVNDLKICDPAVGSGHFLVSALNEMIAVKNDLKILEDRNGRRLKEYHFEVVNDELVVTDEDGALFEYRPGSRESQRVQEALFHEKQNIIEHCLFGVDINPNSVKICRLRLWIELLKNAYYNADDRLETLPNIDINIKCGNSLISRFDLDTDLRKALRKSNFSIETYRAAVAGYQRATDWEEKRNLTDAIDKIKENFRSEIALNDPLVKKASKLRGEIYKVANQSLLFDETEAEKEKRRAKEQKLAAQLDKVEAQIEEIQNNQVYDNAFEWRFEFPEVLDDDGKFVGFDVVIGNPPYILVQSLGNKNLFNYYRQTFKVATYKIDTYALFYELGINILADNSMLCYITPNTFLKNKHSRELRQLILSNSLVEVLNFYTQVFEDASVDTLILMMSKGQKSKHNSFIFSAYKKDIFDLAETEKIHHVQSVFQKDDFELELDIDSNLRKILSKIESETIPLKSFGRSYFGIQTFDRKQFVSTEKLNINYYPVIDGGNVKRYKFEPSTEYVHFAKESIKSGGDPSVYKNHRIVVRQIGLFPEGTIIEPDLMTLNTIYNIFLYNNNEHFLRFLLALINSKLFQFYWLKKHYDNKATFPKIKKAPIESLPIKEPNKDMIAQFSELVEHVLENKKHEIETSELETQIDHLVYQLYGLTEEEIAIVEGSVR